MKAIIDSFLKGQEQVTGHKLVETFVPKVRVQCTLCEFSFHGKPMCGKEIQEWCDSFKLVEATPDRDSD